jgi:hypothetical protein
MAFSENWGGVWIVGLAIFFVAAFLFVSFLLVSVD